jgi:hypothetical protein
MPEMTLKSALSRNAKKAEDKNDNDVDLEKDETTTEEEGKKRKCE